MKYTVIRDVHTTGILVVDLVGVHHQQQLHHSMYISLWFSDHDSCPLQVHPHSVQTEDDVLHIKNLPSFQDPSGDTMGQQDVELLVSYLTVPYLRLPLVLKFFCCEDRIQDGS